MSELVDIGPERGRRDQPFSGNGGNGNDGRLRQIELDLRELKTEQRHAASKEDLNEAEARLSHAFSTLEARLVALDERTDAIKEHYATKWFILTSMIAVGSLIVAAMKLL